MQGTTSLDIHIPQLDRLGATEVLFIHHYRFAVQIPRLRTDSCSVPSFYSSEHQNYPYFHTPLYYRYPVAFARHCLFNTSILPRTTTCTCAR